MSTISLKCKVCGRSLDVDEEREVLYCPYCGSKEIFEESDAVKQTRIRAKAYRDVALGSKEIKRQMQLDRDVVRHIDEYSKEFRERRDTVWSLRLLLRVFSGMAMIVFIALGINRISTNKHLRHDELCPPLSSETVLGMDYQLVEISFQDAGFTKVLSESAGEGENVYFISIDGDSEFKDYDWFPKDSTVRIFYGDSN